MEKIINCCKHDVVVKRNDGRWVVLNPGAPEVRAIRPIIGSKIVLGFEILKLGKPEINLPNPQPGVLYLVSRIVLEAIRKGTIIARRNDLIAPDTYKIKKHKVSKKKVCMVYSLISIEE